MTDKYIIKPLECCLADKMICDKCPIKYECVSNPLDAVMTRYALDLIKHQQKEIERLKIENQSLRSAASSYKLHYNKARTEAIKEFCNKRGIEYVENNV